MLIYPFIHDHGYEKELFDTYFAFATYTQGSSIVKIYNHLGKCEIFIKVIHKFNDALVVSCVQYFNNSNNKMKNIKREKGLKSFHSNGRFMYFIDGRFISNSIRHRIIHNKIENLTNLLLEQKICPLLTSLLLKESKNNCIMIDKSQINNILFD